jgi:hypothetical protein
MRAMARDPGQRFPDMRALIAALEPFAAERLLPPVSDAQRSGGWLAGDGAASTGVRRADGRSRRRALAAAAGIALAISGAALAWSVAREAGGAAVEAVPPIVAAPAAVPPVVAVGEGAEQRTETESPTTAPTTAPTTRGKGASAGRRHVEMAMPAVEEVPAQAPAEPVPRGKLGIEMKSDQF